MVENKEILLHKVFLFFYLLQRKDNCKTFIPYMKNNFVGYSNARNLSELTHCV